MPLPIYLSPEQTMRELYRPDPVRLSVESSA